MFLLLIPDSSLCGLACYSFTIVSFFRVFPRNCSSVYSLLINFLAALLSTAWGPDRSAVPWPLSSVSPLVIATAYVFIADFFPDC
jgi:hypothetical protein